MNFNSIPKVNYVRDIYGVSSPLVIPLIPEDEIISFVEQILGKIPRITWLRNQASFTITQYRIEGLFVNEQEPLHRDKRMTIFDAAEIALIKFPHNTPNYDDLYDNNDDNYLPGPRVRFGYCQIEISLLYDEPSERYFLVRKRLRGDSFSASTLFGTFGYEFNTNILWMTRKPYISLMEGVEIKPGKEDHISKYLFNDLISKEVCSYISESMSIHKPVKSSFLI